MKVWEAWKINVCHNPFIKYNLLWSKFVILCNVLCTRPQHLCNGTLYKFISPQKTFLCNFSNRVVGFIVANYISCDTVRWFSHFQKLENTSRCIVFWRFYHFPLRWTCKHILKAEGFKIYAFWTAPIYVISGK